MKINEIFCSLQGESTYAGELCIFIRFTGCNLRCGYCDTAYAYKKGNELSVKQVIDRVKRCGDIRLVELTGGEPLLQEDEAIKLVEQLDKLGKKVLLETNGSLSLEKWSAFNEKVFIEDVCRIMDIKCPSSGCKSDLKNLKYLGLMDEVKFVIGSKADYEYAKKVMDNHNLGSNIPASPTVLLSPVWKPKMKKKLAEWIIKDKLDATYQIQLHKVLKLK
jgi:7-carboxy-7-deazaguanine synthase